MITFESETWLFTLNPDGDHVSRVYPGDDTSPEWLQESVRRLVSACKEQLVGENMVFRKRLLSFRGHQAIAIASYIQQVSSRVYVFQRSTWLTFSS